MHTRAHKHPLCVRARARARLPSLNARVGGGAGHTADTLTSSQQRARLESMRELRRKRMTADAEVVAQTEARAQELHRLMTMPPAATVSTATASGETPTRSQYSTVVRTASFETTAAAPGARARGSVLEPTVSTPFRDPEDDEEEDVLPARTISGFSEAPTRAPSNEKPLTPFGRTFSKYDEDDSDSDDELMRRPLPPGPGDLSDDEPLPPPAPLLEPAEEAVPTPKFLSPDDDDDDDDEEEEEEDAVAGGDAGRGGARGRVPTLLKDELAEAEAALREAAPEPALAGMPSRQVEAEFGPGPIGVSFTPKSEGSGPLFVSAVAMSVQGAGAGLGVGMLLLSVDGTDVSSDMPLADIQGLMKRGSGNSSRKYTFGVAAAGASVVQGQLPSKDIVDGIMDAAASSGQDPQALLEATLRPDGRLQYMQKPIEEFNLKPKRGVELAVENKLCGEGDAAGVATWLKATMLLDKVLGTPSLAAQGG